MEKRIFKYLTIIVIATLVVSTLVLDVLFYEYFSNIENYDLTFGEIFTASLPPMVAILVLILVVLYMLSTKISKIVLSPIKNAADNIESILSGEEVEDVEIYPEIKPFVETINRQKKQIEIVMNNLKEAEKVRREFTANVSHELKTPLTSINGYAEMIANGMVEGEEVKKFAGIIQKEGTRLLTLIESILNLSKLEDESVEKTYEEIDLYETIKDVVHKLKPQAVSHKVNLEVDGEVTHVKANKRMIEDLVYNLIDNAIKYNVENGNVLVSIKNEENNGLISVKDTGIGIPQEEQDRIFERFYRIDKSRSKKIEGSGLGLSIVKHIVEYHNGSITLESEVGKGTTITIKLPK
jgi:two-component system phosphate regulon sensor histidine kinase PhoR